MMDKDNPPEECPQCGRSYVNVWVGSGKDGDFFGFDHGDESITKDWCAVPIEEE